MQENNVKFPTNIQCRIKERAQSENLWNENKLNAPITIPIIQKKQYSVPAYVHPLWISWIEDFCKYLARPCLVQESNVKFHSNIPCRTKGKA